MKRFLLIAISALMLFSLCACGEESEVVVQDGMKLAGAEAGNAAVYYSFTYPETWELIRNDGVIEIQLDCDDSAATAKYATLSVLSFSLYDPNQLVKPYWEEYQKDVEGIYEDYRLLDTEEYDTQDKYLDDAPALKVKYSGRINNVTYVTEQIICCRNGSVYLITLVVPEEYTDKVEGVISVVKDNFKFA